jgi:hypothetical protein
MKEKNFMSIFRDGLLIDIDVSFWSGAKILKAEDLGLKEKNVPGAYKLGRKMLVPPEVIRAFRSVESRARHIVEINSFKFPIGNARFIPKKKFSKVSEQLKKCEQEYKELTEKLISNYEQYRDQMLPVYHDAAEIAFLQQSSTDIQEFSIENREIEKENFIRTFMGRIQSYYPESNSLRSKFGLSWDVYEIALPHLRKGNIDQLVKDDIFEQEYRDQAQSKIKAFVEDVVLTLRTETIEICNRISENIKDGKIVKGRTLNSLKDFIEKFQELNFVGDTNIESQLQKLKTEFLDVCPAEKVGESDFQEELHRRITEISSLAENTIDINTITGEYNRQISWE